MTVGDFGSRDGSCDDVDNPDDIEGNVVNVEDDSLDGELVGVCCWSNRLVRKQSQGQASKHPLPPARRPH